MTDVFTRSNARDLFKRKSIWLFGDSNMRGIYKDLVWLLQKNSLIINAKLQEKLENSFMNDKLLRGNKLHGGRDYEEERAYYDLDDVFTVEFMFITRCTTRRLESKFEAISSSKTPPPDLVIINSLLWDICRWGPGGVTAYKQQIPKLMRLMKSCLPPETLVIWLTTPPLSASIYGALVIKQIEYMQHSARFEVMEGNLFVRQEVIAHGFDVLDLHYHLLLHIDRRRRDGIHWDAYGVRHITNLILTHVALSWGHQLPGNFKGPALRRVLTENHAKADAPQSQKEIELLRHLDTLPIAKDPEPMAKEKKEPKSWGTSKSYKNSRGANLKRAYNDPDRPSLMNRILTVNDLHQQYGTYFGSSWTSQIPEVGGWCPPPAGTINPLIPPAGTINPLIPPAGIVNHSQPYFGEAAQSHLNDVNQRMEQIASASWDQIHSLGNNFNYEGARRRNNEYWPY